MRDAEQLLESALKVIQWGYCHGANVMAPLLSGGHDSVCACFCASQHKRFTRDVHHIKTGIGAAYTLQFVEQLCKQQQWNLVIHQSPKTYEEFIRKSGFPGPGSHRFVYQLLKDRCVGQLTARGRGFKTLLITGCRSGESVRRMGHVDPVKMGQTSKKTGKTTRMNRIWCSPCHDWTVAEQIVFMDEFGLPRNKLKSALGMSGECFCGAFAQPGELELIRQHAPDVAAEIDRLTAIAEECGTPSQWGTRPQNGRVHVAETGPMCSSCDRKAAACGLVVVNT